MWETWNSVGCVLGGCRIFLYAIMGFEFGGRAGIQDPMEVWVSCGALRYLDDKDYLCLLLSLLPFDLL